MKNSIKTIAKINNVAIQVDHESIEKWVPVRPICEALGVSFQGQLEKIKEHPILSSILSIKRMVAADNKNREMQCLPIRYIFGWLFTIHPSNVNEDASNIVIRYQQECYNELFKYLSNQTISFPENQQPVTQ